MRVIPHACASFSPKVMGSAWTPWLRPIPRRQLVLERSALQHFQKRVGIADQKVGRLLQLYGKGRVEHVGAGHPLVQPAPLGTELPRRPR